MSSSYLTNADFYKRNNSGNGDPIKNLNEILSENGNEKSSRDLPKYLQETPESGTAENWNSEVVVPAKEVDCLACAGHDSGP